MLPWTLRIQQWALSISGGKEAAGNGWFPTADSGFSAVLRIVSRDVAAGICILEEAGGLLTTANPPAESETTLIEEARVGGRLYLAIR